MDVMEAIFTRQSNPRLMPDPLPRALVEMLLEAAAQAPNHHRVRPWHFLVISGEGRLHLGSAMAQALKDRNPECTPEALTAESAKPLRAPLLVGVAVNRPVTPRESDLENICAAAAAAQNLLLAAHGLGLGAIWRTGAAVSEPGVKISLGLDPEQHLIGFIYLGYPLAELPLVHRPSFEDRTTWIE